MPNPIVNPIRKALDDIDDILVGLNRIDRGQVIDVLTALRGPDNADENLKCHTTTFIRVAALPRTCKTEDGASAANRWVLTRKGSRIELPKEQWGTHFGDHIFAAWTALGLY